MRKKDINSITHDLLRFHEDTNPLLEFSIDKKLEVDLINGDVFWKGEDDLWRLYKEKVKWFHNRVIDLKGSLKDFEEAKIFVQGTKEKVKIVYKGETFEREMVFHNPNERRGFLTMKEIEDLEPIGDLSDDSRKK